MPTARWRASSSCRRAARSQRCALPSLADRSSLRDNAHIPQHDAAHDDERAPPWRFWPVRRRPTRRASWRSCACWTTSRAGWRRRSAPSGRAARAWRSCCRSSASCRICAMVRRMSCDTARSAQMAEQEMERTARATVAARGPAMRADGATKAAARTAASSAWIASALAALAMAWRFPHRR